MLCRRAGSSTSRTTSTGGTFARARRPTISRSTIGIDGSQSAAPWATSASALRATAACSHRTACSKPTLGCSYAFQRDRFAVFRLTVRGHAGILQVEQTTGDVLDGRWVRVNAMASCQAGRAFARIRLWTEGDAGQIHAVHESPEFDVHRKPRQMTFTLVSLVVRSLPLNVLKRSLPRMLSRERLVAWRTRSHSGPRPATLPRS